MLIGGIALLLSFLLLPLFVVAGYGVRAIRAGMDRAAEPPVFDDWGTLLTEEFVASIIAAAGDVYREAHREEISDEPAEGVGPGLQDEKRCPVSS